MSASPVEKMFSGSQNCRHTILIVEDEGLLRISLSFYLQECGFEVLEACNADEAIAKLRSRQAPVDVVFSDVLMPGTLDGIGLAQWIRQARPGLPVVLVSGDMEKCEAAKILCDSEPFFEKPYDFEALVSQFRRMIEANAICH